MQAETPSQMYVQCALKSSHHDGCKHHLVLEHGIDIVALMRRRSLKELCEWFVVERICTKDSLRIVEGAVTGG